MLLSSFSLAQKKNATPYSSDNNIVVTYSFIDYLYYYCKNAEDEPDRSAYTRALCRFPRVDRPIFVEKKKKPDSGTYPERNDNGGLIINSVYIRPYCLWRLSCANGQTTRKVFEKKNRILTGSMPRGDSNFVLYTCACSLLLLLLLFVFFFISIIIIYYGFFVSTRRLRNIRFTTKKLWFLRFVETRLKC